MKKTILIVLVLALLAPAAAFGATEFSLGGYIKLDFFWDSTQGGKNALVVMNRNNDSLFHHGHLDMTAQATRFNFTIKGPKLWGATTTGFIEMDFDNQSDHQLGNGAAAGAVGGANGAGNAGGIVQPGSTHNYTPRLRHAMFRLNWPETELLFGQYWGMFSEWAPETTGDADFMFHGWANQRTPQIRLTQKFAGDWTVAALISKPYDPGMADVNFAGATLAGNAGTGLNPPLEGQSSETPQLQGKLAYEHDWWGKAPFYGRPRGFVAQVTGGWQRTRYRNNFIDPAAMNTFGENAFVPVTGNFRQEGQQYLSPWMVQGTLFVPVLPTYSNNLAGSASITAQYFIGQGTSAFGNGRDNDNSWFKFSGLALSGLAVPAPTANEFERRLMNQWGGYIQAQYWFTNQWFINATWGQMRNYGVSRSSYASNNDQAKIWQEIDLTLWYRPIESLKFGLQYAYERTDFFQKTNDPTNANLNIGPGQGQISAGATSVGDGHRIQFAAFMFF